MPTAKKDIKEEMMKEVFLALVAKWDVKGRQLAKELAQSAYEIADGYAQVYKEKFKAKK